MPFEQKSWLSSRVFVEFWDENCRENRPVSKHADFEKVLCVFCEANHENSNRDIDPETPTIDPQDFVR